MKIQVQVEVLPPSPSRRLIPITRLKVGDVFRFDSNVNKDRFVCLGHYQGNVIAGHIDNEFYSLKNGIASIVRGCNVFVEPTPLISVKYTLGAPK